MVHGLSIEGIERRSMVDRLHTPSGLSNMGPSFDIQQRTGNVAKAAAAMGSAPELHGSGVIGIRP
jgi:hypothetical protein